MRKLINNYFFINSDVKNTFKLFKNFQVVIKLM